MSLFDEELDSLLDGARQALAAEEVCSISEDMFLEIRPGRAFGASEVIQAVTHLREAGMNATGFQLRKGPVSQMYVLVARDENKLVEVINQLRKMVVEDGTRFMLIDGLLH